MGDISCSVKDRVELEWHVCRCGCRPTHASGAHVTEESKTRWTLVDKKKHSAGCMVKGRTEPCNIEQVRVDTTQFCTHAMFVYIVSIIVFSSTPRK